MISHYGNHLVRLPCFVEGLLCQGDLKSEALGHQLGEVSWISIGASRRAQHLLNWLPNHAACNVAKAYHFRLVSTIQGNKANLIPFVYVIEDNHVRGAWVGDQTRKYLVHTYLNLYALDEQLLHLYVEPSAEHALLHLLQDGNHHDTPGTRRATVTVQRYPFSCISHSKTRDCSQVGTSVHR